MSSPSRNRVTPLGDIVAIPLRGAWTGNRGILHAGREIVRFHAGDLWITCTLDFRDRRHDQWRAHHFTWLYFHDEAVALAAGHRPCAECRREAYGAYRTAWAAGLGVDLPSAKEMNRRLHGERIVRGTHRRRLHRLPWSQLPDGAFVLLDGTPAVVSGGSLVEWTYQGYVGARARPGRGTADVITPPASVAALSAGYPVQIAKTKGPERASRRPSRRPRRTGDGPNLLEARAPADLELDHLRGAVVGHDLARHDPEQMRVHSSLLPAVDW